jgi:hypothetical protein
MGRPLKFRWAINFCLSNVNMSPVTAELKCPHGRGKDLIESEAVTEVASHEDGGGGEDHLEGGRGEDRCVLPAGQADSESSQGERNERVDSWQYRAAIALSSQ